MISQLLQANASTRLDPDDDPRLGVKEHEGDKDTLDGEAMGSGGWKGTRIRQVMRTLGARSRSYGDGSRGSWWISL